MKIEKQNINFNPIVIIFETIQELEDVKNIFRHAAQYFDKRITEAPMYADLFMRYLTMCDTLSSRLAEQLNTED